MNEYRYQYIVALENIFNGLKTALGAALLDLVMFGVGRSDSAKGWAIASVVGWIFVCRKISGVTGRQEFGELLPQKVKKWLHAIYRRFIAVPLVSAAVIMTLLTKTDDSNLLIGYLSVYIVMCLLSYAAIYKIVKSERRRLIE